MNIAEPIIIRRDWGLVLWVALIAVERMFSRLHAFDVIVSLVGAFVAGLVVSRMILSGGH